MDSLSKRLYRIEHDWSQYADNPIKSPQETKSNSSSNNTNSCNDDDCDSNAVTIPVKNEAHGRQSVVSSLPAGKLPPIRNPKTKLILKSLKKLKENSEKTNEIQESNKKPIVNSSIAPEKSTRKTLQRSTSSSALEKR